jgi:hypothetical protein
MATTTYSILGQATPSGSNATLYASPAATQTIMSTIAICNTTSTASTATVYVCKATGNTPASASTANALIYQMPISANSTQTLTIGLTLTSYDTVYVSTGTANSLTFHAFGSQIA